MSNTQQNELDQFKRDINLLPDKLEKLNNEKEQITKMPNGSKRIAKNKKKRQNKTKQIKREINLLQNRFDQFKKRQSLDKGLKQIAKMQNLLQNKLNQIAKMKNQSRDELEQIAKMRRIKNYEEMSKEGLIISPLKSKRSIAEFFNNNLDNDNISDIKRILNRLGDVLSTEYRKEIKKGFMK